MLLRQATRQSHRVPAAHLFWLALFALLNGLDLLTTYIDLNAGMREGNPLMRALLYQNGFAGLIFYKALMVVIVSIGILLLQRGYPLLARITLGVCNLLVLTVVISNVVQYQL